MQDAVVIMSPDRADQTPEAMITVAGEALIDMLVSDTGEISAHPGGGPFNVARAVARLGPRCQFLGRLSDDAFGLRLRAALLDAGVTLVVPAGTPAPTTLALAVLDADGVADYRFYLEGTSAGQLALDDVRPGVLSSSRAIVLGGLGLLVEPMASTLAALLIAAAPATTVLLDPNCRPRAISDLAAFRATGFEPPSRASSRARTWSRCQSTTCACSTPSRTRAVRPAGCWSFSQRPSW